MKAIIEIDVPDYQIGQEVSIYFKDTMMIKGVVQEPCGDAVSRQAVLDTLDDMDNVLDEDRTIENYKELLKECYEVLPPVNPQEPKTGHWIEHPEIKTSTPEYLMFYECSECGDKQCFYKSDINKKHFCNNCGARMESEEV